MKILYFIDAMHYGGAAKKTSMIANELSRRGEEVSVVTDTNFPLGFQLDPSIKVIPLYDQQQPRDNRFLKVLKKLKRVRSIVSVVKPDVIITVLPHVSFYVKLALLGKSIPIVFSDETSFARKQDRFTHFIRHRFYNVADAVIVLTENDIRLLGKNIPKKVAIHNPVDCPVFNGDYDAKEKTILAIGPLKEWDIKGFDLLFNAFSIVAKEFPDWRIKIAGEDSEPYKSQMLQLIEDFGIGDCVDLLGYRSDIYNVMALSSIFALSSRVEGFSLSLIEALSQGCVGVAFDNHGVITEVSCNGKGVLIVKDGDVEAFSKSLSKLMADEELRIGISKNGLDLTKEYGIEVTTDKWEHLINKVVV